MLCTSATVGTFNAVVVDAVNFGFRSFHQPKNNYAKTKMYYTS